MTKIPFLLLFDAICDSVSAVLYASCRHCIVRTRVSAEHVAQLTAEPRGAMIVDEKIKTAISISKDINHRHRCHELVYDDRFVKLAQKQSPGKRQADIGQSDDNEDEGDYRQHLRQRHLSALQTISDLTNIFSPRYGRS